MLDLYVSKYTLIVLCIFYSEVNETSQNNFFAN